MSGSVNGGVAALIESASAGVVGTWGLSRVLFVVKAKGIHFKFTSGQLGGEINTKGSRREIQDMAFQTIAYHHRLRQGDYGMGLSIGEL